MWPSVNGNILTNQTDIRSEKMLEVTRCKQAHSAIASASRAQILARGTFPIHNIAFIIEGDSSVIMNMILRSLSVIYGSVN